MRRLAQQVFYIPKGLNETQQSFHTRRNHALTNALRRNGGLWHVWFAKTVIGWVERLCRHKECIAYKLHKTMDFKRLTEIRAKNVKQKGRLDIRKDRRRPACYWGKELEGISRWENPNKTKETTCARVEIHLMGWKIKA